MLLTIVTPSHVYSRMLLTIIIVFVSISLVLVLNKSTQTWLRQAEYKHIAATEIKMKWIEEEVYSSWKHGHTQSQAESKGYDHFSG